MMRDKDTKQRVPTEEELQGMLGAFRTGKPSDLRRAAELFRTSVDPVVLYQDEPDPTEVEALDLAFCEWLIFDHSLRCMPTLLEEAARTDPSLQDLCRTQFFSTFWVMEQDRRHDKTRVRETSSRLDLTVSSPCLARRRQAQRGTLGMRVARVGGTWLIVGSQFLHDNKAAQIEPSRGEVTDGLVGITRDQRAFLRLLGEVLGRKGTYGTTLLGVDRL